MSYSECGYCVCVLLWLSAVCYYRHLHDVDTLTVWCTILSDELLSIFNGVEVAGVLS